MRRARDDEAGDTGHATIMTGNEIC
jgi:hypothetical protein